MEQLKMRMPATWGQFINDIGIMGAIVLFLVYTGAQTLPAMNKELQVLKLTVESNSQLQRDLLAEQQKQSLVMRQMCSSLAKLAARTDDECFK